MLDTSLLLSLSVFLILDNILLFIIPVLVYFRANIKKDIKHFILLTITPLVFVSSVYIFLEFFSQESYLFSSFLIGDDFTFLSKPVFSLTQAPFALVCCYYLIAVIAKISRGSSLQRRSLDLAGIFFFFTPFIILSFQENSSGSEYHYFSLILVYFIAQIFSKKINSSIVNFIFISIIASIIIFKFLI